MQKGMEREKRTKEYFPETAKQVKKKQQHCWDKPSLGNKTKTPLNKCQDTTVKLCFLGGK
jgi:hypothetical protein